MENYINEIIEICKLPLNEICDDFKIICVKNKIVYICNFKKILDYTHERIIVKTNKNNLTVSGENLEIKQMNKGEIVLTGEIVDISFGDKQVNANKE